MHTRNPVRIPDQFPNETSVLARRHRGGTNLTTRCPLGLQASSSCSGRHAVLLTLAAPSSVVRSVDEPIDSVVERNEK